MISELLKKLQQQQIDSHQKGYLNGLFASQRIHSFVPYVREDENIFFSSAIVFTLQEFHQYLSKKNQLIATEIICKVINCYPSFKNFKGGRTYNFFKTKPMDFFPNGNIMHRYNFFKLADDADDTAYVYLTDKKQKHKWLQKKLVKHANGTLKWSLFQSENYRDLKAYGVYFGKKMHIEIDICVLSNILIWSFKNNIPSSRQNKDSISYILKAITTKDYINTPYLVAPCYPTTAQICYHISRLIKITNNNHLLILKSVLIKSIKLILEKKQPFINQLFYHIALLNLGDTYKMPLSYNVNYVLKKTNYFYTSLPLMIPKLWVRKCQKYRFFNSFGLRTTSDAYTTTLMLEYELLYKNKTTN